MSRDGGKRKREAVQRLEKVVRDGDVGNDSIVSVLLFDIEKQAENGDDSESRSQQLVEDTAWGEIVGEYIEPPTNPLVWAYCLEQNTRLCKCVHTYARNVVGLGWDIVPVKPATEETTDAERKAVEADIEKVKALFLKPNKRHTFTRVMYLVKVDEEATGNGYLEVTRNVTGEVDGLYHLPSHTMKVRRADKGGGFIQLRGSKKSFFKEFGDDRILNVETGNYYEKSEGGKVKFEDRGTEVIHFMIYTPRSSYYGVPRYVATAPAISGNRLAAIRNVSFFENDAVPRMIITVSGGKLTTDSVDAIKSFLRREGKGVENAHRVMVLQTEAREVGLGQEGRTGIGVVPLTVGTSEDASFGNYRKANDEEVRESFGISKAFFTTENANRSGSVTGRAITNEQEFAPDRTEKEFVLNQCVVSEFSGRVKLKFREPKGIDALEIARVETMYAAAGALTPNDLRASLGLASYPATYKFADKPLSVAILELQLGIALAIEAAGVEIPEKKEAMLRAVKQVCGVSPEDIRNVRQELVEMATAGVVAENADDGNGKL